MGEHHRRRFWQHRPVHARAAGLNPGGVVGPKAVVITDANTSSSHVLPLAAVKDGMTADGRYVASCGVTVLPAPTAAPARSYCPDCHPIPVQRRRGSNL